MHGTLRKLLISALTLFVAFAAGCAAEAGVGIG